MRVLLRRSDGWEKEVIIERHQVDGGDFVLATPTTDITFTYQDEEVVGTPVYVQTREQMRPR